MPQLAEVETLTKLIFNTPSGGDTIKVGATQTYGPVDVDHYDQIRVAFNIAVRVVRGASDSIIYPVPGEKLTITLTASGPLNGTAKYDLLVYGSR